MLQYRQGGADCVPRTFIWPNETKLSSGLPLLRCLYSFLTMLVLSEKSKMGGGGVEKGYCCVPNMRFPERAGQARPACRAGLAGRGTQRRFGGCAVLPPPHISLLAPAVLLTQWLAPLHGPPAGSPCTTKTAPMCVPCPLQRVLPRWGACRRVDLRL